MKNEPNQKVGTPIVALASAPGAAAISVIRASGRGCLSLIDPCIPKWQSQKPKPNELTLCAFVDPESKSVIDRSMVAYFAGPASFTGEDSIEVFCHGGPYVVNRILKAFYSAGFRQANPGEFTQRAFLLGKLDLTQAEGIKELVAAQSESQWLAASALTKGRLAAKIQTLRSNLIKALALLEARIDFPDEEDTDQVDLSHIGAAVSRVETDISQLMDTFNSGQVATRGLKISLVGRPNAGKSTLLNTLLQNERAIVTEVPGTTRDYIEETCLINGRLIRLVDTAGIRDSEDRVEKLGIEASLTHAANSDLVLLLICPDTTDEDIEKILSHCQKHQVRCLPVATKLDQAEPSKERDTLAISSLTGAGLDLLRSAICQSVDNHLTRIQEDVFITSERHFSALTMAQQSLHAFLKLSQERGADECLAFELQQASRHLDSVIGAVDTEDILDKVFSEFCVGK